MDVSQEGIRRIGSDAIATIRTEGLLGDKYIEILKGTTNLPEKIPDVVRIKSYTPPELEKLLGQSEELVNNITSISQNLDELVKAFNKEENIQNISKSLASLRRTLDGIEAEQKSSETTLKKIDSAVAALNVLLAEVKTGNGVLNALFYDKNLRAKLDQAIANVNSVAEEIGGEGGIATELKKTVSNLREISEKLNGGEGTLGALINDPALYDEVKGLVGESQRSKFVRTAVRYLIDNKDKESDQKK